MLRLTALGMQCLSLGITSCTFSHTITSQLAALTDRFRRTDRQQKNMSPQIRQYHISYCENHTGVDEKKRERKRDDEMNKDLPIPSE